MPPRAGFHRAEGAASSLKTAVYIANDDFGGGGGRGDEVYIGARRVEGRRGESVEPAPVFIRLGQTYLALVPLILTHPDVAVAREVAVRVRPEGKALAVSFYNHQDEPIDLTRRQCSALGSGFVCEMGSADEDGSFDAFRARFAPEHVAKVPFLGDVCCE